LDPGPVETNLTGSVERLAKGDLSYRAPAEGGEELALLGETLNRMAEDLQIRMEQISQHRRTRDRILSAMAEGVVLLQREEVAYLNPAAGRLLGASPTRLREVVPHALRRLVEDARGTGDRREGEAEIGFPPRIVQAAAVPLGGADQVLLVVRDVTEARRVEAMRRDFVADASHELKTPAASIRASSETLADAIEHDPAAARRFAVRVRKEAERLSRIVSDLLDLSRMETRRPRLGPVRLDRVAEEEAARVTDRAAEAGVRMLVETGVGTTVLGDEEGLRLLVANLLDNAIRYTDPGGEVRVAVERGGDGAGLTVSDTGTGIPTRDLPRVFERFYRVDRARSRDTGGTGLGLSIARHVTEQHGGRIEVHSELSRGSIFRVRLPLAEEGDEVRGQGPPGG
jgi:two-component system, OmpR family, phosphate regulon sensor histidine kinase PhoR